jgi:hypothetical protein
MAYYEMTSYSSAQLGPQEFERVMRNQIQLFVQRQLSNTLTVGAGNDFEVMH